MEKLQDARSIRNKMAVVCCVVMVAVGVFGAIVLGFPVLLPFAVGVSAMVLCALLPLFSFSGLLALTTGAFDSAHNVFYETIELQKKITGFATFFKNEEEIKKLKAALEEQNIQLEASLASLRIFSPGLVAIRTLSLDVKPQYETALKQLNAAVEFNQRFLSA